MKIMMLACMALAMCAQSVAQSQSGTQSQGSQNSQNTPSTQNANGNQTMQGKVSKDATTLTTDNDSQKHNVNNPDALKDYKDQNVAVLVHVDPDTGTIHIIRVEPTHPQ
jgi:hypothetical protein